MNVNNKTFTGLANAPVSRRLEAFFGVSPEMQRQIGTFVVTWGMFETNVELLIWLATGEEPHGKRPSTDAKQISQLIETLRNWAKDKAVFPLTAYLVALCESADNLAAYRNALVHGRLYDGPKFVANGSFIGEVRKRPQATAHVTSELLEKAITAADILHQAVSLLATVLSGQLTMDTPIVFEACEKLPRAAVLSIELRYLAEDILNGTYP